MILLCARKKRDPLRFAMQVLNAELGDRSRVHQRIEGFQREGILFLPVHRNRSDFRFQVEEGALRTGFASVPGFTEEMAGRIVEERRRVGPFTTLPDFLQRLSALRFPRPILLRLAGALEEAEEHRESAGRETKSGRGRPESAGRRASRRGGRRGRSAADRAKAQIALPLDGLSSQTGSG
jgi:DNA polymerase III alpha subunit